MTPGISHFAITNEDIKGFVHFEFVPQGHTVTQDYYVEILKRLREAMSRNGLELWPIDWILLCDNALRQEVSGTKIYC